MHIHPTVALYKMPVVRFPIFQFDELRQGEDEELKKEGGKIHPNDEIETIKRTTGWPWAVFNKSSGSIWQRDTLVIELMNNEGVN